MSKPLIYDTPAGMHIEQAAEEAVSAGCSQVIHNGTVYRIKVELIPIRKLLPITDEEKK